MSIEFQPDLPPNIEMHECHSRREGDVIIFTCPLCPTYRQTINLETQERTLSSDNDPAIFHKGNFVPVGVGVADVSAS